MDLINIRTKKCRMQQNTETSKIFKAQKNSSNQSKSTSLYDGCFTCYNNFRKLRLDHTAASLTKFHILSGFVTMIRYSEK